MNLTNQQKSLLRQIVAAHEATGGKKAFTFTCGRFNCSLLYTLTMRYVAEGDYTDLSRLRTEGLVDFSWVSDRVYQGRPTERGILAVHNNFGSAGTGELVRHGAPDAERGEDVASLSDRKPPNPNRVLDTERIQKWISDEGYQNADLAQFLKCSERVISSIRNNGKLHGRDVLTKLAILMDVNEDDLYKS